MASSWCSTRGRACAVALFVAGGAAGAATIIDGHVRDATTGTPSPGTSLHVERNGTTLGRATSLSDGSFQLSFDAGNDRAASTLNLVAAHPDYVETASLFSVASGRASPTTFELELLPRKLAHCMQGSVHAVLIGQFVGGGTAPNRLSQLISEALTYNLDTLMQRHQIAQALEPRFPACSEAEPPAPQLAGRYARALRADALIFGRVANGPPRFEVTTFIGSDESVPPHFISKDVDLDSPYAAELEPKAHAAILTALAIGYEREGKPAECVEATVAAERLEGALSASVSKVRERCQRALPTSALRRGAGP